MSRLCNSECSDKDFELLHTKFSYYSMGYQKCIEKGFEDDDVMHIYTKNKELQAYNNRKILNIRNPIALIESENIGRASSISNEQFNSLSLSMYLYVGAKVVLTKNILNVGLSNSSTGIMKEFFII